MRQIMVRLVQLGALILLGGCSLAISGETRARLRHAFANGRNPNVQLGDVSFKAARDLQNSLSPFTVR